MNQRGFWQLKGLSDGELQAGLKDLLVAGGRTEARIVAHLAEVDARKLHLALGASSLFDYCLNRLGLSNNEAFHRITAARLARKFPLVFELLETRAVHLTAVCLLRDHRTPANHAQLLNEVSHKTKTQIEELLARRFPRPGVASRLRKLPSFPEARGPRRALRGIEPLSGESYRLQVNVSGQLKQKIDRARDLTSHANPLGDLAVLVERAFDVLLERLEAKRFAETKRPRALPWENTGTRRQGASVPGNAETRRAAARAPGNLGAAGVEGCDSEACVVRTRIANAGGGKTPPHRAHLRNQVRHAVAARDGHRCTFTSDDGQRCSARALLEFHHETAWALGGADTAPNLKLMCRAHNRLIAERELGADRVHEAIEAKRANNDAKRER